MKKERKKDTYDKTKSNISTPNIYKQKNIQIVTLDL